MQSDTVSQCPTPEELLQYVRRELADSEFNATNEHLQRCSRCDQLVQQLSTAEQSDVSEAHEMIERLLSATTIENTVVVQGRPDPGSLPTTDAFGSDNDPASASTVDQPSPGNTGPLEEVQAGQSLGDFYLVQSLGAGSFAKVFLARQESLQWLVALKVTMQRSDEAPTMARMDHENIVRLHGFYPLPEKHLLLISTKYVPGGTLDNVLHQVHDDRRQPTSGEDLLKVVDGILELRGESVPEASEFRQTLRELNWPQTVCWLGAKLANALDHAHQRDVLHRDIKPANVLLSAEGSPMLADFNISFSSELKGADAGAYFGGSLLYMSPEQLDACNPTHSRSPDELDGRSDIHSLGLLLWELLTGQHPFIEAIKRERGRPNLNKMSQTRRRPVPDSALERLPKETSPGLKHALLKCLQPEPKDRFANAGELAGMLEKQLVPGMQQLLYPRAESWRNLVLRQPLVVVTLVALIPSLLLTPVNIILNVQGIINQVSQSEQDAFWNWLMPLVNGIVYPIPTLLLIAYAWPMLTAVKRYRQTNVVDPVYWKERGRRILYLGFATAALAFAGWLATGIAFPLGVDLAVPAGEIGFTHYVQFIVSQALHAVIAAAGTYFLVTFLCVHAIYPRLIPDEPPPNNAHRDLKLIQRSNTVSMVLLGISPLLAIVALATVFWDKSPELRFVFVWLALLGEIGFLLAWMIGEKLKPDLETLQIAVRPNKDYKPTT